MQKIQEFQFNRIYTAPKSTKTYELIDQNDAFEEVLFSDGVRLRANESLQMNRIISIFVYTT